MNMDLLLLFSLNNKYSYLYYLKFYSLVHIDPLYFLLCSLLIIL